jgi:DNA-binding MarR family transcriptional regulator
MEIYSKRHRSLAQLVGEFMQAMHRYDGGRMLPLVHTAMLTMPQLAVLEYVQAARTVSAVAMYAGLSRPATSAMVDKLVRRGLVRRSEGILDRRERAVVLSAAGCALVAKVHAARAVRFEASLAVLPPRSIARLTGALTEVLAKLRSGESPARARVRRASR